MGGAEGAGRRSDGASLAAGRACAGLSSGGEGLCAGGGGGGAGSGAGAISAAASGRGLGWVGARLQSGQVGTYAWVLVIGVLAVLGAFSIS